MLQQYLANKIRILRSALAAEFNREMIQDAMAIILCPKHRGSGLHRLEGLAAKHMVRFIRAWSEYRLPNPLEEDKDYGYLLDRINKLHNQLLLLIEDFITKGTASHPPREYSCLPQRRTNERHLMFRGHKIARRFDSAYLSAAERKRFLRTFLVHELCSMTGNIEFHQQALNMSRNAMIYTRILSRTEYEALECVDGYYRSLYGAMFAQCANDGRLPRANEGCSLRDRIRNPNNSVFDAEHYEPELAWYRSNGIGVDNYAECFSRLGLHRILEFLSHDMTTADGRKALQVEMKLVWDSEDPGKTKKWADAYKSLLLAVQVGPLEKVYKSIGVHDRNDVRLMVAQQSAWVFFDDERFYPPAPTYRCTEQRKQSKKQPGKKYDRREIVLKCGRRDRPKRCIRRLEEQSIRQSRNL
ncbi:hypothetical protein NW768_002620 [Fusarium equiseti]|uniref:Uncharacterized protein n=1 Tax=Fusarium equiseti TaxID=61235 RepID=A0ABQ8RP65_FUSEQ|nr:hypothetical protein NW768_002620 [Fusarium equiseti]